MLVDGSTLKSGERFDADVCIVGAGPAGLSLARGLLDASLRVLVVESGGIDAEPDAQALNDGEALGDQYSGLRATRRRQLGGSANAWNTPVGREFGAKYAPLDPSDFSGSPAGGQVPGWPIEYCDVLAHYEAAHAFCQLGAPDYSAGPMQREGRRPFELGDGPLTSRIYRFGSLNSLLAVNLRALRNSEDVRVLLHATICRLSEDAEGRIAEAAATTTGGMTLRIRARFFVLAAGAIENARLLLLSRPAISRLNDDLHRWIGHCFMEHPRDRSMALLPSGRDAIERATFYDVCTTREGTVICGRIAFAQGPPPGSGLPNASVTVLPIFRARGLMQRLRGLRASRDARGGYGWSTDHHVCDDIESFRLLINLEQSPRTDNRVELGQSRDRFGQPRAVLHWRWTEAEQRALQRLRALIAAELHRSGIGHVVTGVGGRPDPNAHHHAGTTRMAESRRYGVVDQNSRVFGIDNLYIAGASVFSTAGFANPTLTIVALSMRLAGHLRERI